MDTHVWQLAIEHYTPALEGKSLTPRLMAGAKHSNYPCFI